MPQPKKLEKDRVDLASTTISLLIIEGSQNKNSNKTGTQRQELMKRPWRVAAYWLAFPGFLSILSYGNQNHQLTEGSIHN